MLRNQFALLKEEAGSPMSSVMSVTAPTDLDASVELAKPDKEWMDMQSWTRPPDIQSLDARRSEFDRCESTLLKAKSDLGFDVDMVAMRPADVLRSTAHIAEESTGYLFSDPGGRVVFTQILSQLLDRHQEFAGAHTVYLIVDSRLPHLVDYWPAFQPWWTSREQLVGPHKELTRLVWYHINNQSGVQYVPHIWAGVFVLLVARFLFPTIHIALVDTDCVPVSLFEIEDLILLSKLQMSAHSTNTPPGGASASDQPTPGMILFSEECHDINAGLVVSIADPTAASIDLSTPVEDLERLLLTRRDVLLASSAPSQTPTTMLRQGTLLTPFLGTQCKTPLDLCWVWALQGLLLTRIFWPIPQNWTVGDPWPRRAHDSRLHPEARSRIPSHTDWARGTFEQGALSLLPELSAVVPAVVLPGPRLFQANRVDPKCMRPAVFHCFGRDKSGAKTTLRAMALEGWETLLAVLLGVGHLCPLWQQTGWTPFGGMCWHGSASAATLSAPLQRHLREFWKPAGQHREPQWQLSNQEPAVHLHRPQTKVSQIHVEPLNSARDAQLPGIETNATASPGGPLGPSAASASTRSMPSMPLPSIGRDQPSRR